MKMVVYSKTTLEPLSVVEMDEALHVALEILGGSAEVFVANADKAPAKIEVIKFNNGSRELMVLLVDSEDLPRIAPTLLEAQKALIERAARIAFKEGTVDGYMQGYKEGYSDATIAKPKH